MRALELQLLRVVHMPQAASAAAAGIGAVRPNPVLGWGQNGNEIRKQRAIADVRDPNGALLAGQRARDKQHLPVHTGDARALNGGGFDRNSQTVSSFEIRHGSVLNVSRETFTPPSEARRWKG